MPDDPRVAGRFKPGRGVKIVARGFDNPWDKWDNFHMSETKEIRIRKMPADEYKRIAVAAAREGFSVPQFCAIAAVAFCLAKENRKAAKGGK